MHSLLGNVVFLYSPPAKAAHSQVGLTRCKSSRPWSPRLARSSQWAQPGGTTKEQDCPFYAREIGAQGLRAFPRRQGKCRPSAGVMTSPCTLPPLWIISEGIRIDEQLGNHGREDSGSLPPARAHAQTGLPGRLWRSAASTWCNSRGVKELGPKSAFASLGVQVRVAWREAQDSSFGVTSLKHT